VEKHSSNYLIEEVETKENANGTNVVVLGATLYIYKADVPAVDKIYKLQVQEPFLYSSFTSSIIQFGSFSKDSHYPATPEVSFDLYDVNGNILQKTTRSGIIESTIWGYHGAYPVAKIIGATYNTAVAFVNMSAIANPPSEEYLKDELGKIRTGLSNSSAQVLTYTFKPFVGITSETDPRGRATYYRYDNFGRLILVLDNEGNVVKKNCYNIDGQSTSCANQLYYNTAYNNLTYRNNCSPGKYGTPIHPNVPAGMFSSAVSQSHANSFVAAYAQSQANLYGRCIDPIWGRIEYVPVSVDSYDYGNENFSNQIADVWIKFYSDAACTQPLTLTSNIPISISTSTVMFYPTSYTLSTGDQSYTALSGTDGLMISGYQAIFGQWQFLDENGNETYFERWTTTFYVEPVGSDCIEGPTNFNGLVIPNL
jgi:YD repeat-containing protein